jgi:hypothetical protein
MANFNWHMSIKPVDIVLLLRKRAMDDPLFAAVSCSPDITISLVLKYPAAKWNIEALSYNRAISVQDKLDNPQVRWTIMNLDDETVPLDVVRHTSHRSWSLPRLFWGWDWRTVFAAADTLAKSMDWRYLSSRAAGEMGIVVQNVSSV